MLRTVKLPYGWDRYIHTVAIGQGGTGEKTPPDALKALGGVFDSLTGLPNGVVPLREDGTIDPKYFGTMLLEDVTVDGDDYISGGETKTYHISNYDMLAPYFITPIHGTFRRDGPLLFYTADNIRAQGGFIINGKRFLIEIAGAGPVQATIISPRNNVVDRELQVRVILEPYKVNGNVAGVSWRSTDWQISRDEGFANIEIQAMDYTESATEWTTSELSYNTKYYVRARFNSHGSEDNPWSKPIAFTTRRPYSSPFIIAPVINASNIGSSVQYESSVFVPYTGTVRVPVMVAGITTSENDVIYTTRHESTDWQIADNSSFNNPRSGRVNGDSLVGLISELSPGMQYYIRVRHNHMWDEPISGYSNGTYEYTTKTVEGTWSHPSTFRTLSSYGPNPPEITSPQNLSTGLGPNVLVQSRNFYSALGDEHVSTDWELSEDALFSTLARTYYDDTANLLRINLVGLPAKTQYYVRARYKGKKYGAGNWSNVVGFSTKVNYGSDIPGGGIRKPSIYKPTEGQIIETFPFEVQSSEFDPVDAGPHLTSDWQISQTSNFTEIDKQIIRSVANKTTWTVENLPLGKVYFVRVKHNSRDYGSSLWSDPLRFRTKDASSDDGGTPKPNDMTVIITSIIPGKATITNPANNSTNNKENVVVRIGDYTPTVVNAKVPIVINDYSNSKMEVTYSSIHTDSDWEISLDPSFSMSSNITRGKFNGTEKETTINGLQANTTYYLRVRQNNRYNAIQSVDQNGVYSHTVKDEKGIWSEMTIFSTALTYGPPPPRITSHIVDQEVESDSTTFTVTGYVEAMDATYLSTDWELSESIGFPIGSTVKHTTTNKSVRTWMFSNIEAGHTYYVRVRHNTNDYKGAWSPIVNIRRPEITVLPPVTKPVVNAPNTGTELLTGSFTLRYSPFESTTGASFSRAEIQVAESQDFTKNLSTIQDENNDNKYEYTNVPLNKTLYIRVRYVDSNGEASSWSESIWIKTPPAIKPSKPSITKPTNGYTSSDFNIALDTTRFTTTSANSFKKTEYELMNLTNNRTYKGSSTTDAETTVTVDTAGEYQIKARHIDSEDTPSDWSDSVHIHVNAPPPGPGRNKFAPISSGMDIPVVTESTGYIDNTPSPQNTPYSDQITGVLTELYPSKTASTTIHVSTCELGERPEPLYIDYHVPGLYWLSQSYLYGDKTTPPSKRQPYVIAGHDDTSTYIISPDQNAKVNNETLVVKAIAPMISKTPQGVSDYELEWIVQDADTEETITTVTKGTDEHGEYGSSVLTLRVTNVEGKRVKVKARLHRLSDDTYGNYTPTYVYNVGRVAEHSPLKPRITSPVTIPGTDTTGKRFHRYNTMEAVATTAAYGSPSAKEHASSDWHIALDEEFTTYVRYSYMDTENKTSYPFTCDMTDSFYYLRVRHRDVDGNVSPWSEPVAFYSPTHTPEQPVIRAVNEGEKPFPLTVSDYESDIGTPSKYIVEIRDKYSKDELAIVEGSLTKNAGNDIVINEDNPVLGGEVEVRIIYESVLDSANSSYTDAIRSKPSAWVLYNITQDPSIVIEAPGIVTPTANELIYLDRYTANITSSLNTEHTHVKTDWIITEGMDDSPSSSVARSFNSDQNLTSWEFSTKILNKDDSYYLRARYRMEKNLLSPWSNAVLFRTPLSVPLKPIITQPENNATVTEYKLTIKASKYIYPASPLKSVKWFLKDKLTGHIVTKTTEDPEITIIEHDQKTLIVTVQYESGDGKLSEISNPVEFTGNVTPLAKPGLIKPVEGGKVYELDPEMSANIPISDFVNVEWQVATDDEFNSLVLSANTSNSTKMVLSGGTGERYLRIRYTSPDTRVSVWSDTIHFTAESGDDPLYDIEQPTITKPTQYQLTVGEQIEIEASAFNSSSNPFKHAEWELVHKSTSTPISIPNTTLTTTSVTLSGSNVYRVRVRYVGTNGRYSRWSDWREFGNYVPSVNTNKFIMLGGERKTYEPIRITDLLGPGSFYWVNSYPLSRSDRVENKASEREVYKDRDLTERPTAREYGKLFYSRERSVWNDDKKSDWSKTFVEFDRYWDSTQGATPIKAFAEIINYKDGDFITASPVVLRIAAVHADIEYEIKDSNDDSTILMKQEKLTESESGTCLGNIILNDNLRGKRVKVRVRILSSILDPSTGHQYPWSDWIALNISTSVMDRPYKPKIVGYSEGLTPTVNLSGYTHPVGTAWASTDWQIGYDRDFKRLVNWAYRYTGSASSWQAPILEVDTVYYIRARVRDVNDNESEWSDHVVFFTPHTRANKPSITLPVNSIEVGSSAEAHLSKFESLTDTTPSKAQYRIKGRVGYVEDSDVSITNDPEISTLPFDRIGEIDVQGRWVSVTGAISDWSDVVVMSVRPQTASIPGTPSIITPIEDEGLLTDSVTITLSPYVAPTNGSAHTSTTWEIYDTTNFNMELSVEDDTENLVSRTFTPAHRDHDYTVRAKYTTAEGISSEWSEKRRFTSISERPRKPNIIQPLAGTTITTNPYEFIGSEYKCALSPMKKAVWEIKDKLTGFLVEGTHESPTVRYNALLPEDLTIQVRVRYISNSDLESEWSVVADNITTKSSEPNKPTILTPTSDSYIRSKNISANCTPYSKKPLARHVFLYARWQVATDNEFNNIVASVNNGNFNETSWSTTLPDVSKEYYIRVLHISSAMTLSDWSDPVKFTVDLTPDVAKPTVTHPTEGKQLTETDRSFTVSEFSGAEGQTLSKTHWMVAENDAFTEGVIEETLPTSVSWMPDLLPNKRYYIRVRHQDNFTKWSPWSDTVQCLSLTTIPDKPVIVAPTTGGIAVNIESYLALSDENTPVDTLKVVFYEDEAGNTLKNEVIKDV